MANDTRRYPKGLFWGLLVIAVGVIFLLDEMGIVSASHIFQFFWPAIFIFFGLEGLLFQGGPGRFWGAFLTVVGILLLLNNFHYVHVSFAVIWPLAIIFWGLWIMVQAFGAGEQRWKSRWVNSWAERVSRPPNSILQNPGSTMRPYSVTPNGASRPRISRAPRLPPCSVVPNTLQT